MGYGLWGLWRSLRLTLWFLPGLMALGGVALFALTYTLDSRIQSSTGVTSLPIFFSGGAAAARALLSAIVGSLITVIATIFSVTIVTLQLASSQYSPRLLQRFMSDRLVQVVLGTYAATFIYAILVLRIVRSPAASSDIFNPLISVPVALLLALISVALLVYFIHHIADMSQSSSIVQAVHDDGIKAISELETLDNSKNSDTGDEVQDWKAGEPAAVIIAKESGYARFVDKESLLRALAEKEGTVFVEFPLAPGAYVTAGLPSVKLWLSGEERLSSEEERRIEKSIVVGPERTMTQDPTFSIRQLADIALKGLSPGINDPTTSVQALNSLGSMLVALGGKRLPRRLTEHESNGSRRLVWIDYPSFDEVAGMAFDQIRRAAFTSGQVAVLERVLDVIERSLAANVIPGRQGPLWSRVYLLARQSTSRIPDSYDTISLCRRAVTVGSPLLDTALRDRVVSDLEELAGLCDEIPGGDFVREDVLHTVKEPGRGTG